MEKGPSSLTEEFQLTNVDENKKNIKLPSGKHYYNNCYKQELPKNAALSGEKFENRISALFQRLSPKIPSNYKETKSNFTSRET